MNLVAVVKKFNKIFSKEQKIMGIIVLIFSMVGAVLETIGVSAIIPFTDVLLNPSASYSDGKYGFLINTFQLRDGTELIVFFAIVVAVVYVIKNLYFIFLSWLRAKYSAKIERELSVKVLENYMYRGYGFFINTNTGTLLRSIQNDVTNTYLFLYNSIKLITDILIICFIVVYIIFVDWKLAVGVGIMSILFFSIIAAAFSKLNINAGENSRHYLAKSNQVLLQALQGAKEVLVLKKEHFFVESYRNSFRKHVQANSTKVILSEIPAYIIEGICVAVIFTIICIRVVTGGVTDSLLPTLASFVVAAFRILPSLGKVTSEYSSINYCYAGLEAVYESFKELESVNKLSISSDSENESIVKFEKDISINSITFSYEDCNVINQLSMKIRKGEAVAFIGPSGSGKTTLSDIVLGLLKVSKGEILVDGINIESIPFGWSKMIGYVSQTMYLADETIRFNVAFGEEEKDINDDKVWECLRKAHIDDYIFGLEDTIHTVVGDRGVKFSGGQRQRIAIARALYHDPQILVLDEATSALDNETENEVMQSIDELKGEITMIIVAHRLSTIRNCNRIFEITNGIAIERNKEDMEFV